MAWEWESWGMRGQVKRMMGGRWGVCFLSPTYLNCSRL